MRLRPEVAERLYREVPVGTQGKIVYRPVKIFKTTGGKVLLEVYRDVYKKGVEYADEVRSVLAEMNATNDVDWEKIRLALEKKDGVVRDVSR
jgi:L,D-transpeptidase ErfK/SrfK